jgi:hypothetical protein
MYGVHGMIDIVSTLYIVYMHCDAGATALSKMRASSGDRDQASIMIVDSTH